MSWGFHLILDCGKCIPTAIRNPYLIKTFAKHLVKDIDMVAYGPPVVKHFGSENKAGYTLVQLIETSNIVAHFVEETDDMYLDVFSCKPFKSETVEEVVSKYFSPKYQNRVFLVRQAPNKTNNLS
jgi:hypothetical protein